MLKKAIKYTIFVAIPLTLLILIIASFVLPQKSTVWDTNLIIAKANPSKESSASSSSSSVSADDDIDTNNGDENYFNATNQLESKKKASVEEVDATVTAINSVMVATGEYQIDDLGELVSKYFLGHKELVQTFWIMCQINHYQLDNENVVVTKSKNDDVLQFIAPFNGVEGYGTVYLLGNYNINNHGIELLAKYGDVKGATYG